MEIDNEEMEDFVDRKLSEGRHSKNIVI